MSGRGKVNAVLGAQWGDEGKGKLVDILASEHDIVARVAGGSNAGHTIVVEGKKYAFHLLPSGILSEKTICVIGNGVVLHVPTFFKELDALDAQQVNYEGRIKISDRAHLLFDFHQTIDAMEENTLGNNNQLGTTKQGIGPCYSTKASRIGIRVGDLQFFDSFERKLRHLANVLMKRYPGLQIDVDAEIEKYREYSKRLLPLVTDTVVYVNEENDKGKSILIEGANAVMLDIDFGTYPYVTSSNPTIGGGFTGLGIAPNRLNEVYGVVKAYTTRVGAGPFPTELHDEVGEALRAAGREFGTTTGRPRRCGWFDAVVVKYANMINGYAAVNLTKLDVLNGLDEIKIGVAYRYNGQRLTSFPASLEVLEKVEVEYETLPGWKSDTSHIRRYEDLPAQARAYVERIEQLTGCKIRWIGVGPARDANVEKK